MIPLLIAGFIIFNTMLSSLAERKREIYIYTSLGLAPLHIGVLFLSEAITYGLLGSIFGYITGQGVATLFSALFSPLIKRESAIRSGRSMVRQSWSQCPSVTVIR